MHSATNRQIILLLAFSSTLVFVGCPGDRTHDDADDTGSVTDTTDTSSPMPDTRPADTSADSTSEETSQPDGTDISDTMDTGRGTDTRDTIDDAGDAGVELPDPLESLQKGEWKAVSKNTIKDVDPCPMSRCDWSGVEGLSGVINDWTGGAYATEEGPLGGLVYWGGGHNGYYGTEVYFFNVATLSWERRGPTTGKENPEDLEASMDCRFADGNPLPNHTYDDVVYTPNENRFWTLSVNDAPSGQRPGSFTDRCGNSRPAFFDFDDGIWSDAAEEAPFNVEKSSTAYDAKRDLVWALVNRGDGFGSMDPSTGEWTKHGDSDATIPIDTVGDIATDRDLFVVLDLRSDNRIRVRDLTNPGQESVEVEWKGDDAVMEKGGGPGFGWAPNLEAFVTWNGGQNVYLLEPPASDWKTQKWNWTVIEGTGAEPGSVPNSPYSKFQYVPSLGIAFICPGVTKPVYAIRLR